MLSNTWGQTQTRTLFSCLILRVKYNQTPPYHDQRPHHLIAVELEDPQAHLSSVGSVSMLIYLPLHSFLIPEEVGTWQPLGFIARLFLCSSPAIFHQIESPNQCTASYLGSNLKSEGNGKNNTNQTSIRRSGGSKIYLPKEIVNIFLNTLCFGSDRFGTQVL